ncbi:TasA family protein [Intrasporangium sp. DVR]|uniref:TasA family protein n=1 Tax=Intrasporangium sp. DVR TaxID=3127867 RepID=UPI00313A650D
MNSKKILVPLATLVAAGAIAVGSGATFTSTSNNTISSVASGTLTQSNSKANAAIFNVANIKPGDTVIGKVTITNTGTLPGTFSLKKVDSTNTFSNSLNLNITNQTTGVVVYNGPFGALVDGTAKDLGVYAAGASNTYVFTVTLALSAPDADQGKIASAGFTWDAVQLLEPTTYDQS